MRKKYINGKVYQTDRKMKDENSLRKSNSMLIIVFIFHFLTFFQPRSDSVLAGFAAWHGNCESVQTGAFGGVPRPNGECALGRCATLGRRTVVKSGTQALAGFNAHNVFHLQGSELTWGVRWWVRAFQAASAGSPVRSGALLWYSRSSGRERGTRLTHGELALRWTWLNFCLTSETKQDLEEGKVLTR